MSGHVCQKFGLADTKELCSFATGYPSVSYQRYEQESLHLGSNFFFAELCKGQNFL